MTATLGISARENKLIKIKYARSFRSLPKDVQRTCLRLTVREESGMREEIKCGGTPRTWVAYDGRMVVGWAILTGYGGHIMLYVRSTHRKQGIGGKLYRQAYGHFKRYLCRPGDLYPMTYPHDKASYNFFSAMGTGVEVPRWAK